MQGFFGQADPMIEALIFAVVLVASWGAGWALGRRGRTKGTGRPAGKLEDAILAILGLLLAFTFSMALGKYERRREMVITDSNSIGDFYTCASLLKDTVRTKLQGVIREYTELRLSVAPASGGGGLAGALPRFQEMQNRMTALVGEATAEGTPIAIPLTDTLNNLTSAHGARLAAVWDRVPDSVTLLLFVSGALCTLLIGRDQGLAGNPLPASTASFIIVVTLVVYVIFDLNHPSKGFILISQEPMQRVLQSMGK